MSARASALAAARSVGRSVDLLLERPRWVLGTLVALQIALTLVLALSVEHNGWVWFQGGDQIWMTTTGWLLGRQELPPTEIAYLWPAAQAPITWATGPTYVQALPPIVLGQVLVLGPVALLCVYGIAARIGGRLLGYWASLLWVVAPFAVIPLFVDRYHERWIEQFLPQALGLTAMSDFPSMVIVLAGALFVVRSLSPGRMTDAVLAGVLIGAAAALKPPNLLVAVGAALAYVVARRWREGLACGAAILPALLVLLLWKVRGLGELPVLALEQTRIAASGGPLALDLNLDRYFDLNFEHWRSQMNQLREFFWSARVAQWVPVAGLVAVLSLRRGAIAALLGGWLAAFLAVKGFSERAFIENGSFWRLLMPAWPAYLLLFASIPLLVPTAARRLGDRMRPVTVGAVRTRWIVVAATATVALPALAIAISSPLGQTQERTVVQDFEGGNILTPIDAAVELAVRADGPARRLTWTGGGSWRADVFYRVYRHDGPGADTTCLLSGGVAWYCLLDSEPIATTRDPTFVDASAPPTATYRIGVGTNWADDPAFGDVFAFSLPVAASG
ncbi:MAG TPA: hypothetical protein VFU99_06805 [Gaiellaceae bacterium]|nr:hypothetical protein [Gaiellaceae bacterium]